MQRIPPLHSIKYQTHLLLFRYSVAQMLIADALQECPSVFLFLPAGSWTLVLSLERCGVAARLFHRGTAKICCSIQEKVLLTLTE